MIIEMKKIIGIAGGLCIINVFHVSGQNMGIGTTTPHPSARVDIVSNDRGLLIPRLTTAQRDAITNPAHSLLIFNKDNFCIEAYDSVAGQWLPVSCPSACSPCDTCPLPVINGIVGPTSICPYDSVTYVIDGSGGHSYTWDVPNGWVLITPGDSGVFLAGSPGVIYGSICNQCGCVYDSLSVVPGSAPQNVTASSVSGDTLCILDTITIVATSSGVGSVSYQWNIPSGLQTLGSTTGSIINLVATNTGTYLITVQACNGCGCSPPDSVFITLYSNTLPGTLSISGLTSVCIPDTIVYKASHSSGQIWTWQYPASWQLVYQGGDSIVLIPDTTDGNIIANVCDTLCNCLSDTLFVVSDSCAFFCVAIGGSANDEARSVVEAYDGGYLVVGATSSFGAGGSDIYLVKIAGSGAVQWTKTIGGTGDEVAETIIKTLDGGYLIQGYTTSFGASSSDIYLVKLDGSANVQWTSLISRAGPINAGGIEQAADSSYIISFMCGVPNNRDICFGRVAPNGTLVSWGTIIGSGKDDAPEGPSLGYSSSTNSFVWTGSMYIPSTYSYFYLAKGDATTGNITWRLTYSTPGPAGGNDALIDHQENIVFVGRVLGTGLGGYDAAFVKLDPNGNSIWQRAVGGISHDLLYRVKQNRSKNYVSAGWTLSMGAGGYDMMILEMDTAGNIVWNSVIGGTGDEFAYDFIQTSDGGYIVVGKTSSGGSGGFDMYIVKIDSMGGFNACPTNCQLSQGINAITPFFSRGGGGGLGTTSYPVSNPSPLLNSGGNHTNLCQ